MSRALSLIYQGPPVPCKGTEGSGAAIPEAIQGPGEGERYHSSPVEGADPRPSECRVPHSPWQALQPLLWCFCHAIVSLRGS